MARPATNHDPRRRELIAAAEAVFVEKGYRATTLNDLLTVTGLSKGGFYHYFRSKDDVLRASLAEVLDEADDVLRAAAALPLPPADRLTAVFHGMRDLRARRGEFGRTLAVILGDETPARDFHDDVIRRLAPSLSAVLEGFPAVVPRYTAELVLDLITALTRSPYRATYVSDPGARDGLVRATRGLLAGALGIRADDPMLSNFGW
ncbi:TetR/AcrR family transcriptional regulator [Actinoplanes sp. N902-109]|uniref:TetR/AcrR family transcriptional regulator n=1 Tax=Actinoplanes sp. (strain N902-109) TaxID=649831 RepID=UPI00032961A7|nr:TetR/AcrR family transcriptional regulator [Actinoplanes sp. N902-109]AGL15865.1 TetR family transcriptional regulator [Actinoplanes sp. N902-109]